MLRIDKIENSLVKQNICRNILSVLPEWFGIPQAIDDYVKRSSTMPFWAAYDNDEIVGFISLKPTSAVSAEIYVMGVLKAYHRRGIGKDLFTACYNWCKEEKYEFMQVKTLDESHPDMNYANTRKYYEAIGFKKLECINEIWGRENPCIIMIMSIK